MKIKKILLALPLLLGSICFGVYHAPFAHAAGATITVNSTADAATHNSECTLREAINNVNAAADTTSGDCAAGTGAGDTIIFAITHTSGGDTFPNGGHTGFIIAPGSSFPNISKPVTINGYFSGTQVNMAVSPNPLNGRLLIEIDGTNAGALQSGFNFIAGSDNSVIKGLVINHYQAQAITFTGTNNDKATGNYIGTDPTGMIPEPNGINDHSSSVAIQIGGNNLPKTTDTTTTNTTVGGLAPADRNLVSGNWGGGFAIVGTSTTVQGNYIGVAADGVTAMGDTKSAPAGNNTGALTIDYANHVLLGGDQVGAANVISDDGTGAVQPDGTNDLVVQGNLIGTDYTGELAIPNARMGINVALGDTNMLIGGTTPLARNIISGNAQDGIAVFLTPSNITIEGNYIGVDKTGLHALPNQLDGVYVLGGTNITLGGTSSGSGNLISGNGLANVNVFGYPSATGIKLLGNTIGPDANGGTGISSSTQGVLWGGNITASTIGDGTTAGANTISGNTQGILVHRSTITGVGTLTPSGDSFLGNSVYNNGSDINIDLARSNFSSPGPFSTGDYSSAVYSDLGLNPNVSGGETVGQANDYLNHPIVNSFTQNITNASVNFDLNVAGATTSQYRVEFFGNDSNLTGQGQTYLGYVNVPTGNNQTANFTLPVGTNLKNKFISASVTQINGGVTNGGFGDTSEIGDNPVLATVLAASTTPAAPNTGVKSSTFITEVVVASASSFGLIFLVTAILRRRRGHI